MEKYYQIEIETKDPEAWTGDDFSDDWALAVKFNTRAEAEIELKKAVEFCAQKGWFCVPTVCGIKID